MQAATSSGDEETDENLNDNEQEPGFGISEACLNAHQRYMTKHEMVFGIHLNARIPLDGISFSPQRKWRYLAFYMLDFAKFLVYEYVTKKLQQLRMSAFVKNRVQFAAMCED